MLATHFKSAQLSWWEEKITSWFFSMFLTAESREILHVVQDNRCEGMVGAKNYFLEILQN